MDRKDQLIAELQKQLEAKDRQFEEMRKLNEESLWRIVQLEKHPSSSSKPPSTDIVKPPKPPHPSKDGKRKRG